MNSATLEFRPNPQDIIRIQNALGQFEVKVQDQIARKALRAYAKDVIRAARAHTPIRNGYTVTSLASKVKAWPNGMAWAAINYKGLGRKQSSATGAGRLRRKQYDAEGVGWRTHFTELGFHSWPKTRINLRRGVEGGGGKGWKKGQYHRGSGQYHRGTMATVIAQTAMTGRLIPHLQAAIRDAMIQVEKGKGAQPPQKARRISLEAA
jgi:hypothetical protein